jgi:hypothetical protein
MVEDPDRGPPTTTIASVATTITLAALRTETGWRRNRPIRRSIGSGREMLRSVSNCGGSGITRTR